MAFAYSWVLKALCQDHTLPGANAARETWTESCAIILCWPHIKLNAVKNNKQKLSDKSLAETANEHITYVHCSRTRQQFDKLLALMLGHWRSDLVEDAFADWFEEEYGTYPWRNWHVTASGIPGFTGNNNAEESFNREAKRGENIKKDTIGVYITDTLPRTIRNWSLELGTQAGPIVNSIPSTPNRHLIMKAIDIVTHGHDQQNDATVCNYFKVSDSLKLTTGRNPIVNGFNGYIVNSSEALYQNDMDYAMNLQRAKTFCLSLEGIFQPKWTFMDAIDVCLKSHAVRVKPADAKSRHPIAVEHALREQQFKFEYECDCQGFWHSLICSHVLAAYHLNEEINLNALTAVIDRPCTVGRPRKLAAVTYAAHKPPEKKLTPFDAAKRIGSILSVKINTGRVYNGRVNSVFEGMDYDGKPAMIYRVSYDHQYDDDLPALFPKTEEFTHERLEQAINLYKEIQKRLKSNNAINCD